MHSEEIVNIICNHTREVVPGLEQHTFANDDTLKNLGANSMDRSEIIIMTLESLSLNIPLIDIAGANNIGELAELLFEKQAQTV